MDYVPAPWHLSQRHKDEAGMDEELEKWAQVAEAYVPRCAQQLQQRLLRGDNDEIWGVGPCPCPVATCPKCKGTLQHCFLSDHLQVCL